MLFCRSSLPLSRQTLTHVTGIVGRHHKQTGSKGRALTAGMQALMPLAYLKKGEAFVNPGAGFGVGTSTARRYVYETVTLLPARSPELTRAVAKARRDGLLYLALSHARLRRPGERANAQLKSWKILTKLRCCPHRAGHLAKAIHVLQNRELNPR